MKKRKISLMLNICTICLAVVAIVIGVYSLQQAKLTVNGSLGFVAHNVNARVDAYMYGYSESAGGAPITEKQKVRLTPENGLLIHDQTTNYSLNLGATDGTGSQTRYFSNLGTSGKMEDIVVEITLSNTSAGTASPINILANVDFANCITLVDTLKDKIVIDCDKSGTVLETTSGKTQTTFTFKISLKQNSDGTYGDTALTTPSANNVQLQMNLEETTTYTQSQLKTEDVAVKVFTATEKEAIKTGLGDVSVWEDYSYSETILCYAERFPYYVEMGEYNSTKLRWLIVGTSVSDGTITTLLEEDRAALSKGLMLNKTYVMLSEKTLLINENLDIAFQNQFSRESGLNDYGYFANDYATSNIRQYLIGNTVKNNSTYDDTNKTYTASGTDVNIMTTFNINYDSMYENIKARSLTNLYNESAISGETNEMLTVPTSKENCTPVNFTSDTPDKLWLLSQTEMQEIFKDDCVKFSGSPDVYMSSRTSFLNGSNSVGWWLRSPQNNSPLSIRYVRQYGNSEQDVVLCNGYGVRPAFLF